MSRRQTVIVEVEAWLPRAYADGSGRQTKKTFRTWLKVGAWPVLYADRENVVVKQFGVISIYSMADGSMESAGYGTAHPAASMVPESHGRWRLNPVSLKKVRST